MTSKELADPFGLFLKYLKIFFSMFYITTLPKTKKAPLQGLKQGKIKAQVKWPGLSIGWEWGTLSITAIFLQFLQAQKVFDIQNIY
ncbi:MAG: hypothetical protein OEW45_16175 [Deltaproteobacteria bacterium]|nr:hypothetical protein [Deltaproteobacteria bacterium]